MGAFQTTHDSNASIQEHQMSNKDEPVASPATFEHENIDQRIESSKKKPKIKRLSNNSLKINPSFADVDINSQTRPSNSNLLMNQQSTSRYGLLLSSLNTPVGLPVHNESVKVKFFGSKHQLDKGRRDHQLQPIKSDVTMSPFVTSDRSPVRIQYNKISKDGDNQSFSLEYKKTDQSLSKQESLMESRILSVNQAKPQVSRASLKSGTELTRQIIDLDFSKEINEAITDQSVKIQIQTQIPYCLQQPSGSLTTKPSMSNEQLDSLVTKNLEEIAWIASSWPNIYDHIKFHKQLGQGSFARVYEATELKSGKRFAVKVIDKLKIIEMKIRKLVEKEVEILQLLRHQNICSFHRLIEDQKRVYLVLELCQGITLNQFCKLKNPDSRCLEESQVQNIY